MNQIKSLLFFLRINSLFVDSISHIFTVIFVLITNFSFRPKFIKKIDSFTFKSRLSLVHNYKLKLYYYYIIINNNLYWIRNLENIFKIFSEKQKWKKIINKYTYLCYLKQKKINCEGVTRLQYLLFSDFIVSVAYLMLII